jgi:hypothetical protein
MLAPRAAAIDPSKMGEKADRGSSSGMTPPPGQRLKIAAMPATLSAPESSLDALQRLADVGLSALEVLELAAARIDRVVPSDGYFMAATDPETTLSIGTGVVRELPAEWCETHWD